MFALFDMIKPILHITMRAAWAAAQQVGEYRVASLDTEGFIHCSTLQQVVRTADRFFRGQQDLELLVIDPAKLQAPLRYEAADDELFPHVYGPLDLDAVIDVLPFPPSENGIFVLPASLA
jgi:uncharacterized protein (DUF952 family)